MTVYIMPVLFIFLLVFSLFKRVKVYDCFLDGATATMSLIKTIFPYIEAIFICIELFRISGFSAILSSWLATPLSYLGIPAEIAQLVMLVPLSGNGTVALLEQIILEHGPDSYIARCASVIAGGSETIFYIAAVYFSGCKAKKLRYAIPVSLFCTLFGTVLACALCRVM
jgi:spore maturation protein B